MTTLDRRIAILYSLVFSLIGCGNPAPPASPETKSNSKGVIGVSLLTLENPFFKVIGDNITRAAREQGYDTIVVSADRDVAKQSNQIKDFLVRKVSALVLSPCESRGVVPSIQEANAAGVPVFTVDIPCKEPGIKIVCQIATDNFGGGKEAGRAMIEALGPSGGKVAIIDLKQAESCRLRVQGFKEVIEKHNSANTAKITIVTELDGGGLKDLGFKATEDALQAHSDIKGIFAINDPSALGARAALEKAQKASNVIIIGFDGQPEGKQAIREGKIFADPIQFPDRMGQEIVQAFLKYSKGEVVPGEILIPTSLYRKADAAADPELK